MGLLTTITENQLPADMESKVAGLRPSVIQQGARLFDESYSHYEGLGSLLDSKNEKDQYIGALTLVMVERTKEFIERMSEMYGEGTITTNLGALPKRILDVVRIFYPNQIATELLDIQPIDGENGEIFIMKPTFSDPVAGITAGDEMFKDRPTYNNYASELFVGSLGTGDGGTTAFAATPAGALLPLRTNTINIITVLVGDIDSLVVDDGNGNLTGANISAGTIDYDTGAISITYTTAPKNLEDIQVRWLYNAETDIGCENIRSIEFNLINQQVKARMHPINFKYSVAAGLAAQAHLAIDVQDTLAEAAGQYLKVERDDQVVALINANATPVAALDFDATPPTTFDRRSFYGEIELKMDAAESEIQNTQGRGGVDWVLCGTNAANVFRNARGFRAVPSIAPIGAHVIGTLRDGTITVVKSLVMDTNQYTFGFKGYMAGDAATILAEWIPIYFTPVFQNPQFKNQQGIMSMYDLFINNAGYYVSGTLSNYSA